MSPHFPNSTIKLVYTFLFFGLFSLAFIVLKPFLAPLGWALILVISTWPIYKKLLSIFPKHPRLCSGLMCMAITLVILLIIIPMTYQLSWEAKSASTYLTNLYNQEEIVFPDSFKKIPIIGKQISNLENSWGKNRHDIFDFILSYQNQILTIAKVAAKSLTKTFFIFFVIIFSAYFLFRYGNELMLRLNRASHNLGGEHLTRMIELIHGTIKATVYGVLLTSLTQGILAGIGFFIVGAPAPILLGIITAILSFIPFGPPFLYVPISLYIIFSTNSWVWGIFLLIWGTVLVSMADNILRPLFIRQATSMSLLLVLLGILGGISAFGLIGIFIGPVVIAICQRIWIEFTNPVETTLSI